MTATTNSPGWYPDPLTRWDFRFWDGAKWTENVSRAGITSLDSDGLDAIGAPGSLVVSSAASNAPIAKPPGVFARRRAAKVERNQGQDEFEHLAVRAANGDAEALAVLPSAVAEARQFFSENKFQKKRMDVLRNAVRATIVDDVLSIEEEIHIERMLDALDVQLSTLRTTDPHLWEELLVARINDGRPPETTDPGILLRKGEIAHSVFAATLLKEVSLREFRGGSSGVSVPIGFGLRYRVGSVRGRSVVVGTQLVPADAGLLVVTSSRSVFAGGKKTLEFRHDRLVGMQQFTDGLRLNVSNRQSASLFKFAAGSSPSIAAALITHCAAQAA